MREYAQMENYNFWQDFFDTYQSLSDWMKFAWLIVPPIFLLGLIALIRKERKRVDYPIEGELIYSIHRDKQNQLHIFRHNPELEHDPAQLSLDHPNRDRAQLKTPIDKP